MASNTITDPAAMLQEILETTREYMLDSVHDLQEYVARPRVRHWLRIIVIVAGYIMLRPLIELFFKKLFESQSKKEEEALRKKREEQDAQLEAEGLKKPRKDANSMRVGGAKATGSSSSAAEGKEVAAAIDGGANNKNKDSSKHNNNSAAAAKESHKDEYEDSDQEDFAEKIRASGVLEWGRDARKKQKNSAVKVAEAARKTDQIDEEKLMEMLDWSEDENEKQAPKP